MKCCDNCKFFIDETRSSETSCHWWDARISLPTDECTCSKWVSMDARDEHPTGRFCNKCGTEVLTEEELDHYPYYCPHCDENMFEFETHKKGN